jgi:hypothetical protein
VQSNAVVRVSVRFTQPSGVPAVTAPLGQWSHPKPRKVEQLPKATLGLKGAATLHDTFSPSFISILRVSQEAGNSVWLDV